MSDNPRAQLEIGADASQAEEAFAKLKDSSRDAATRLAADGARAAAGIEAIGNGATEADQKIDRSTRSMIASIQRTTAAMEAGGTANAAYYKSIAHQRGVDTGALAPYLKQLEEATIRQKEMGTSAQGMSRNLSMVAPQLTDIVVSLQSGQAPMTVLLQQGGQLKDMFGGVGGAAKALGGYIASLVTPYTVAAAAAVALGAAMHEGAAESSNLNKALVMSGNVSGQTAGQLTAMAAAVAESVGTQGKAMETLGAMASNSFIAATGDLKKFATVAGQMDSLVGVPVKDTIKHFEDLGRSPVEASIKLNEQYGYLTAAIFKQIQALQDQGKAADAAALAQRAYADAMEGRIPNIKQNLGSLETAWFAVRDAAKGAWDSMLNVGRKRTLEDDLKSYSTRVSEIRAEIVRLQSAPNGAGINQQTIARLREELSEQVEIKSAIENQIGVEKKRTEEVAKQNAQREASIRWIASGNEYLTKSQKLEQEITKIRNEGSAAGASQAEIESRIAAAREKYAEHTKKASHAEENAYKSTIERIQELASSQEKEAQQNAALTEAEKLSLDIKTKLTAGVLKLSAAHKTLVVAKLDELVADEKLRAADAARAKSIKTWSDEYQKSADSLDEQIKKQREHNDALGLSKEATADLAASKISLAAATDEARAAQLRENAVYAGPMYDEYMREADTLDALAVKRRQLAQEMRYGSVKEAAIDEAKESAKAWEKTCDQINQSLTDALMHGFESGKSFGENFVDSLRNTLETAALKIVIQVATSSATTTLASLAQSASGNSGSGAAGQAGSYASLASSLYGAFGSGGSLSSFLGTSAGGTAGGLLGGWNSSSGTLAAFKSGLGGVSSGTATASGTGQMLGAASKVAWPLAVAYGIYRSGEAYDQGYRQTADTFGGGINGKSIQTFWNSLTLEPVIGKLFGGKTAAMLTGSSLTAQIVDRLFGGHGGPQVGGSWTAGADVSSGSITSSSAGGWWSGLPDQQQLNAQMQAPAEELAKSLATAIKSFGGSGSLSAMFAENFDPQGDSPNDVIFKASVNGKEVVLNKDDQGSRDEATFKTQLANWQAEFSMMVLQAAELPKQYADYFSSIDVTGITAEQSAEYLKVAQTAQSVYQAFSKMDGALSRVSDLSVTTAAGFAELFGGLDSAMTGIAAYRSAIWSDADQLTAAQQMLAASFDTIGVSAPASADAYKNLVESQDLTTEAGRKLYYQLVELAPSFAQVADMAAAVTTANLNASKTDIQGQIDDLTSRFGDLSGALAELNPPAESLVETWEATKAKVTDLQSALDALTVTPAKSAIDQLSETLSMRDMFAAQKISVDDQIYQTQLSAASPDEAVKILKAKEKSLWDSLASATTTDAKQAIVEAITSVTIDRVKAEGAAKQASIQSGYDADYSAAKSAAELEAENRKNQIAALESQSSLLDAQADAIKDQISAVGDLADEAAKLQEIVAGFAAFTDSLRIGDLSSLDYGAQLGAAKNQFDQTLVAAQGGDADAVGKLQDYAQTYLQEAKGYYASSADYAAIFDQVTSALDAFALPASEGTDAGVLQQQLAADNAQLEAIKDQLAVLKSQETASVELKTAVVDTSAEEIAALQAIGAQWSGATEYLNKSAADQQAAIQGQIAALNAVAANQQAQIVQAGAAYTKLLAELDAVNAKLERIQTSSTLEATA